MTWREKHKAQSYYLRELIRQAKQFGADESRLEFLLGAAIDYSESTRLLADTKRHR